MTKYKLNEQNIILMNTIAYCLDKINDEDHLGELTRNKNISNPYAHILGEVEAEMNLAMEMLKGGERCEAAEEADEVPEADC